MISLIKVNAIGSTNDFLKNLVREKKNTSPTCVWAKNQFYGRGQMGATWESESGKNLTFSIFIPALKYVCTPTIALNFITSYCIYNELKKLKLPQLYIKWPNDIVSVNKKIGGILIENTYRNKTITGSIVGIGLNVNQTKFKNLPKASSIKTILEKEIDLEVLLNDILTSFEKLISNYESSQFSKVKLEYENFLFRKGKASTFVKTDGTVKFTGIIQGVTNEGKLIIEEEDQLIKKYNLKEITLLY